MTEFGINLSTVGETVMNQSTVGEGQELELCQSAWCGTQVAIILLVTLLMVGGNLLNLVVLVKVTPFNEVANILLVSLAAADLTMGCGHLSLALYPALYQANQWPYHSKLLCTLTGIIGVGCYLVSIMTLMCLAVDRYLFITRPLRYLTLATHQKAMGVAVTTWVLGVGVCLGAFMGIPPARFLPSTQLCSLNFEEVKAFPYILLTVFYIPVFAVTSFCYGRVFVIAMHQRKRIAAEAAKLSSNQPPESRKNYKALRTTLTVVGAFYLTSAPFILSELYVLISQNGVDLKVGFLTTWLILSNGLLNPIIFGVQNIAYRQGLFQIFTGRSKHT